MPPFSWLPRSAYDLAPDSPAWPARLSRLSRPPSQLRVAGSAPPWAAPIAVVGTRFADEEALAFTRRLCLELAEAGRSVISGGASGIDAAAHRGAIDAGGTTVAVLAHGFDQLYPRGNAALFREIVERGALVSERPDGSALHRTAFIQRNRLIAALSDAVVIVQAPARSGAMSTAAAAFLAGIPVFSVPASPWDVRGAGNLALLGRGAEICTCVRDVLSVRPSGSPVGRDPSAEGDHGPQGKSYDLNAILAGLDADARALHAKLSRTRPRYADELAEVLSISVARLQQALLELMLRGLARENGNGAYFRT